MRYFVVRDEGLGPFVVAEVTDGQVLAGVDQGGTVMREDEGARRYPAAVLAWRAGDDRVASASRALEQGPWEAEAASVG